jgi:predicted Zn-dependent protease
LDAYLEEDLDDLITYCMQNPDASNFEVKRRRVEEIGRVLYADGGVDATEDMFYPIEFRVKEEKEKMLSHTVHGGMILPRSGSN